MPEDELENGDGAVGAGAADPVVPMLGNDDELPELEVGNELELLGKEVAGRLPGADEP